MTAAFQRLHSSGTFELIIGFVGGPQRPPYLGWFPLWLQLRQEHVDVLVLLSSVLLSAGRLPGQVHTNTVTIMRYPTSQHAGLRTYCHQPVMSCEQKTFVHITAYENAGCYYSCVLHDVRHDTREINRKKAKNIQKRILNLLIMSTLSQRLLQTLHKTHLLRWPERHTGILWWDGGT